MKNSSDYHRVSNPRPFGLYRSGLTNCATAYPIRVDNEHNFELNAFPQYQSFFRLLSLRYECQVWNDLCLIILALLCCVCFGPICTLNTWLSLLTAGFACAAEYLCAKGHMFRQLPHETSVTYRRIFCVLPLLLIVILRLLLLILLFTFFPLLLSRFSSSKLIPRQFYFVLGFLDAFFYLSRNNNSAST
jgi:hypothetical protein